MKFTRRRVTPMALARSNAFVRPYQDWLRKTWSSWRATSMWRAAWAEAAGMRRPAAAMAVTVKCLRCRRM